MMNQTVVTFGEIFYSFLYIHVYIFINEWFCGEQLLFLSTYSSGAQLQGKIKVCSKFQRPSEILLLPSVGPLAQI